VSETILDAALSYARSGWWVLPIEKGTKKPSGGNGLKHATKDPEKIKEWWRTWPDAGVAIACAPSGLVVLDVDPRNGGDASLDDFRPIPDTLSAHTGGGGTHFYFLAPEGVKLPGTLAPGLDVKHEGYVLAPPTIHESGVAYEFLDEGTPLAPWPDAWSAKEPPRTGPAPPIPDKIAAGQRNSTLVSLAGSMRRRGLEYQEILAALRVVNTERCNPVLTEEEVEQVTQSVCRYEPEERIGAPRVGHYKVNHVEVGMSKEEVENPALFFERYAKEHKLRLVASYTAKEPLEETLIRLRFPKPERVAEPSPDAAPKSPLRSFTLGQMQKMEIPPRKLIVSPVLGEKESMFVYGPKGSGKTWVGAGLGVVAAQGDGAQFLQFCAEGPGVLTLYIDGEMLGRDMQKRVEDICRTAGLDPGENLRVWTPDLQAEGTPPLNLGTPEGQALVDAHIEDIEQETGRQVGLVVIDNLRTLCPGWEENKAESYIVGAWTTRLRVRGTASLVAHHSNKIGGYSGNTAIVTSVHSIVRISNPKGYTADQGAHFDLTYEYTRAEPGGIESFSARLEGAEWSVKASGHVSDGIITILTKQGVGSRDIAKQIQRSHTYVQDRRKALGLTDEPTPKEIAGVETPY
jgi:bifunctional DNA primase/polymerase-like protein/AAA domain-containing protein/primase-like protein